MSELYKRVSFEDMVAGESVQFVGVHAVRWHEHPDQPKAGFVEFDVPEEIKRLRAKNAKLEEAGDALWWAYSHETRDKIHPAWEAWQEAKDA